MFLPSSGAKRIPKPTPIAVPTAKPNTAFAVFDIVFKINVIKLVINEIWYKGMDKFGGN